MEERQCRWKWRHTLNTIGFNIELSDAWNDWVVTPVIDDLELPVILAEIERPFAQAEGHPEIAGNYGGVLLKLLQPPSRYLFGEPPPSFGENGKVAVLECTCGTGGCWPFLVRISVNGDLVTWDQFEQPHRNRNGVLLWSYEALGTLKFRSDEYMMAIESLNRPLSNR